jgi:hypothetical protein
MALLHFRCNERRRTVRVMLTVPLRVHGMNLDGNVFSVQTRSHTVSLHGASIELEYVVSLGDVLLLENRVTHESVEGKVVTIRRSRDGKTYVGLEFLDKEVNFWHMSFPAPGARPMRRMMNPEKVPALS